MSGAVQRRPISRENNYCQAGERYRTFETWERDELIKNLVGELKQCNRDIHERMVWHFGQCDPDYGKRVRNELGIDRSSVPPVPASVAHGV